MSNNLTKDLLLSAQIHKKVRQHIQQELLKPDVKLINLAKEIESHIAKLTNYNPTEPLAGGVAFPTGLSVNNCAAHWTPNPDDIYQTLGKDDLIKIDWGVHINGAITDGAFTFSFNDRYQPLIQASEDATQTAIDMAGPDAYLGDIGCRIQEVIESYELELDGKTYPLKSIGDLCGHQIGKYQIHCGKTVPNIRFLPLMTPPLREKYRMQEGEVYAIETFPTTGSGKVIEDHHSCSHYMADYSNPTKYNKKIISKDKFAKQFNRQFYTLAFCKRWFQQQSQSSRNKEKSQMFDDAVQKGIYKPYPPLYSDKGSYVAQTEYTVYISPKGAIKLN